MAGPNVIFDSPQTVFRTLQITAGAGTVMAGPANLFSRMPTSQTGLPTPRALTWPLGDGVFKIDGATQRITPVNPSTTFR
ncbi:MAG: hypothetical protein NTW86_03860 [Candidatus Sumerlaeota bacterium]|nr:hypothetical protein [Candidatus Sumerlaeota bacterium]